MTWNRWAKGNVRKRTPRGQMNGLETAYAQHLDLLLKAGEIDWYMYEGIRFRLTQNDKAFYTPDFAVMKPDGMIELHECKGHWEDAALLRIKFAAEVYPFTFLAVQKLPKKDGGGWGVTRFGSH